MLLRLLLTAICVLSVLAGCAHSADQKLVGVWRGRNNEMAGRIFFSADHTFASHKWDATNSLAEAGDWHVSGDKIVLNLRGRPRKPEQRHVEVRFTLYGHDTLVVRRSDGRVNTFEREK